MRLSGRNPDVIVIMQTESIRSIAERHIFCAMNDLIMTKKIRL